MSCIAVRGPNVGHIYLIPDDATVRFGRLADVIREAIVAAKEGPIATTAHAIHALSEAMRRRNILFHIARVPPQSNRPYLIWSPYTEMVGTYRNRLLTFQTVASFLSDAQGELDG